MTLATVPAPMRAVKTPQSETQFNMNLKGGI
jgi:hypothetical protein